MAGKHTLLIVEDDVDIAEMLNAYFRIQEYDVTTVHWGEDALTACQAALPDLVILDIRLPDIDGFEVARRLRANRRTRHLPIIFLTEKREREDRLQGLQLQAEDYITKPFDIQELRLRVRNSLRRSGQSNLTNPVTALPEGNLVAERLRECIHKQDWAVVLVPLDHLDAFREVYGFVASDDLLRATALMVQDVLHEVGSPSDFLGQWDSASFILIVEPGAVANIRERIRKRLEVSVDYFYRDQDRGSNLFAGKRLTYRVEVLQGWELHIDSLEQLQEIILTTIKGA